MRRSMQACLGAVTAFGLVVAGSGIATASAFDAKTVSVTQWSGSVCTSFRGWEAQLKKLGSTREPANPAAGKAAITRFLNGALKATNKLVEQVPSLGVPNVPNGNAIAAAFANATRSLDRAYASARTNAMALPTSDPAAFATAAQTLASQLQTSRIAGTATPPPASPSRPTSADLADRSRRTARVTSAPSRCKSPHSS
jgi:hypothetical protein